MKRWRGGIAGVAVLLGACAPQTEAPVATAPQRPEPAPPVAAPAPPPDVVAIIRPSPPPASYRTLEEYRLALAQHILAANAASVAAGDLDPLLRAIVVLRFSVDARGNMRNLATVRTPEREAEGFARASLTRAGPLPAPPTHVLKNGVLEVTETWLFNADGRFNLRTLGPRQRSGG